MSSPGGIGEGTLWGLLYKSPLWRDLITSQRPHLQTLSHRALGFNLSVGGAHKYSVHGEASPILSTPSCHRILWWYGCNGILDGLDPWLAWKYIADYIIRAILNQWGWVNAPESCLLWKNSVQLSGSLCARSPRPLDATVTLPHWFSSLSPATSPGPSLLLLEIFQLNYRLTCPYFRLSFGKILNTLLSFLN